MKIRTLVLSAAAITASACQPTPPESTVRGLTLDEVQARFATAHHKQALSSAKSSKSSKSAKSTEVGRVSAYVTQVFEGIPAPVEYMRKKCPEKVLSAKTTPLYGLEAPYSVHHATMKAAGIFNLPIDTVNTAVDATYTGEYVVIDFHGMLISLFPEDVKSVNAQGKLLDAGSKILRQISAHASLAPWQEADDNGRLWAGVRVTAQASTPVPPPPALKDALMAEWKEPCQ